MRVLIDTTVLVEAERRSFDLDTWLENRADVEGIFVCDAGIAEWLTGEPIRDEGKRQRFRQYWEQFLSQMPSLPLTRQVCERAGALAFLGRTKGRTIPLGDALHGGVAETERLTVLTLDTRHFEDMGVPALNPLASAPRK
jgi:predicted nucleic acid-binding protein